MPPAKIKINNEFNQQSTFDEINSLIKDYLEIREQGEPTTIDGEKYIGITERQEDYVNILDIIYNLLEEKTNINNVLEHKKCALTVDSIKASAKKLLDDKDDKELYKKFLDELNDFYRFDRSNYQFIIPINLLIQDEDYEATLEKILNQFNLDLLIPDKLDEIIDLSVSSDEIDRDDAKKALELLRKFPLLIKVNIPARMMEYAFKESINRIKSFLGFICHVVKLGVDIEYFGEFDEYNIIDLTYGPIFIVVEDKKLFWPVLSLEDKVQKKLKFPNVILSSEKFNLSITICEDHLSQFKNSSLKNLLYRSFSIYYSASVDKSLEYSFLKFWNVSEFLIKGVGDVRDSDLRVIMQKFVDNYSSKRVEFIYDKRNDLVHKGFSDRILDSDRNLSKWIADLFLIDTITNVKNLSNKKRI